MSGEDFRTPDVVLVKYYFIKYIRCSFIFATFLAKKRKVDLNFLMIGVNEVNGRLKKILYANRIRLVFFFFS